MNTENFLELITTNPTGNVHVAKTSIACIETAPFGCVVRLKEKQTDGTNIFYNVALPYSHVVSEINRWEKSQP